MAGLCLRRARARGRLVRPPITQGLAGPLALLAALTLGESASLAVSDPEQDLVAGEAVASSDRISFRSLSGKGFEYFNQAFEQASVPVLTGTNPAMMSGGDETFLFLDESLAGCSRGLDHDGADSSPVFFYAGHGTAEGFWARDAPDSNRLPLTGCMRIGDVTRYYFQCSCQVFAHGKLPESPGPGDSEGDDYIAPWTFAGGSACYGGQKNIFETWYGVFTPQSRLICGASSIVYCQDTENARRFWLNHQERGLDISDSFILTLFEKKWAPLCMTHTSELPKEQQGTGFEEILNKSPIFDRVFVSDPAIPVNLAIPEMGSITARHLLFVRTGAGRLDSSTETLSTLASIGSTEIDLRNIDLEKAAIYGLTRAPYQLLSSDQKCEGGMDLVAGRIGHQWKCRDKKGFEYYYDDTVDRTPKSVDSSSLGPDWDAEPFVRVAKDFIEDHLWGDLDAELPEPDTWPLVIDSYLESSASDCEAPRPAFLKSVVVAFNRARGVGGADSDTIYPARQTGNEGKIWIHLTPNEQVFRASSRWSRAVSTPLYLADALDWPEKDDFWDYEEAFHCAKRALGFDDSLHRLDRVTFGYRRVEGNEENPDPTLRPTYVFDFGPSEPKALERMTPRQIEVFAEKNFEPAEPMDNPIFCRPEP